MGKLRLPGALAGSPSWAVSPLADGHALGVTGPFVTLTVLMPSTAPLYTGPLTTCHSVPETLPLMWPPVTAQSWHFSDNELILQSSLQALGRGAAPLVPLSWKAFGQVPGAEGRGHTEPVPVSTALAGETRSTDPVHGGFDDQPMDGGMARWTREPGQPHSRGPRPHHPRPWSPSVVGCRWAPHGAPSWGRELCSLGIKHWGRADGAVASLPRAVGLAEAAAEGDELGHHVFIALIAVD